MKPCRLITGRFPKRFKRRSADWQAIREIEVGLGASQIEQNHRQLFRSLELRSIGHGGNARGTAGGGWRLLK